MINRSGLSAFSSLMSPKQPVVVSPKENSQSSDKTKGGLIKSLFAKKELTPVKSGAASETTTPSVAQHASHNSIQIYISCRNLVDLDVMGKSDPFVELLIKTDKELRWMSLGRSEVVWNDLNPDFTKIWQANYQFECNQTIRAVVYEHDEEEPIMMGYCEIPLNKLLTVPKQCVKENLK